MPDEVDPEVLEVVGGQLRQYCCVDRVVAKRLFILLQPETVEPGPDVHARLPDAVTAAGPYRTPIVDGREYSARLVAAQGQGRSYSDSPVIGPSGGRALRRAGCWSGRRVVGFGSFPAVPAGERRGRSTSISGLPSCEPERAYLLPS